MAKNAKTTAKTTATKSTAKKATAKKPVAKKAAAPKKVAAKKPVAKKAAAPKKVAAKKSVKAAVKKAVAKATRTPQPKLDTSAYAGFVKGIQVGESVTVLNIATGNTYTTQVIAMNTKHIVTRRQGSTDASVRFTARGTGTQATGTDGLKIVPLVHLPMVTAGSKRRFRPTLAPKIVTQLTTVEAVEANIEQIAA